MSPRRKIDTADDTLKATVVAPAPRFRVRTAWGRVRESRGRWDLPVITVLAAVLLAGAIAASGLMLWSHETDRRGAIKNAAALSYARTFMTDYTSLDPFNANGYTDRILSYATGDFQTQFKARQNEIAISVARSEPTSGTVVEAGVEQWHGDNTVSMLVTVNTVTTTPDRKAKLEDASRWVLTAVEEGKQWKISQLLPVI